MDFTKLELVETSYLRENLTNAFSDAFLIIGLKNSSEKMGIGILLEHKSYADATTFFQILDYINQTWIRDIKFHKKIKYIVPVLVYHIGKPWPYPLNTRDYLNPSYWQIFQKFTPTFEIISINLDKLKASPQMAAILLLAAGRHFEQEEDVVSWIEIAQINPDLGPWNLHFIKQVAHYIYAVSENLDLKKIIQLLNKEMSMQGTAKIIDKTFYEAAEKKGMEKGMEQIMLSIIKHQLNLGKSKDEISQNIGMPTHELEKYFKNAGN